MFIENLDGTFSLIIDNNNNKSCDFPMDGERIDLDDRFKNKFILYYVNGWNDAGFVTGFDVYYYKSKNDKLRIGFIRICHDDLKYESNSDGMNEIKYFLEKDVNLKVDDTSKLGEKYISIGNKWFYNRLKVELKEDKLAAEFLSKLNEISTITENDRIDEIKSYDWYKKSFISYDEEIVAFTECKNALGINDNSYQIKDMLSKYSDNINNNLCKLYKFASNTGLSIEEVRQVVNILNGDYIDKSNLHEWRKLLKEFKVKYSEYTDLVEKIDAILKENEELHNAVDIIKNILKVKKEKLNNLRIGHYTSLETIKILITKKKNKKDGPYLRLTNGRQMNDPLEGETFLEYILNINNDLDKINNSRDWKPTYWYISSATTELDSLPMWKQYGENATGGVLVYDCDYLKEIVDKGANIYKVAYIKISGSNNNNIKVLKTDNMNEKDAKKLQDAINKLRETLGGIKNYGDYMPLLNELAILFKKSDYAYENEYRIVINRQKDEDKIEEQINRDYMFPFLYTYLKDVELRYSKLVLGPKAIDIDYVAPYIRNCDKSIKIEMSGIAYR